MTTKTNISLSGWVPILLCSLFATGAQAATTMGILEQVSPNVTTYVEVENTATDPAPPGEDFARFNPATSPVGDVTAPIQLIPGLGEPGDFGSFMAGNIALIDRGAILFVDKVQNAEANGAVGVLIANTTPSGAGGLFQGGGDFSSTTIPALMIRHGLGEDLKAQLAGGDTVVMRVATVPEPSSVMLALLGMSGFFCRRRRQV